MKKSTILILLIVFLGSVLIVGIFGIQSVPYEQIVYVKEIKFTSVTTISSSAESVEIRTGSNGLQYVLLDYEEDLEVLINYELTPADCTNKDIKIIIVNDNPDNPVAKITERNTVQFLRKGTLQLQYKAQDSAAGPAVNFEIRFRPKTQK